MRLVLATILLFTTLSVVTPAGSSTGLVDSVNAPGQASGLAPAAAGCVTDWFVSYGGTASFQLLWTDPDGILVEDLRFDHGFHDPYLMSRGYLDFDGDGLGDVFSAVLRLDGALQWRYMDTNSSGWNNLSYAYGNLADLRFGDFEYDSRTDVFTTELRQDGKFQWKYSDDGLANFALLNYSDFPIQNLRFGDFNSDGKTDVFAALPQAGGQFRWVYSPSGVGSFTNFNSSSFILSDFDTNQLAFGDVRGGPNGTSDGATDIFLIDPVGGLFGDGTPSFTWSSPDSIYYWDPPLDTLLLNDLRFGDFDGDAYTDIFFQSLRPDKLWQWHYISGKDRLIHDLAYGIHSVQALRFSDMNGDNRTDVLLIQPRCTRTFIPIVTR